MSGSVRTRVGGSMVAVLLAVGVVAGCSAHSPARPVPPAPASTPSTSAAPATTAGTVPVVAPPPPVDPLTGIGPVPAGAVVAVKIDDTANGRPQRGIDQADLVYVEQVEGGLTRLLAVYAAAKPVVADVRSVRMADPEILAQFGRITLAASGGAPAVLANLDAAPLRSTINDRNGPGFARTGCCAPYNLSANLAQVAAAVPGDGVRDIGLVFGALPAGGVPAASVSTVVGATAVGFVWDAGLQRWVRVIGGLRQRAADGAPVSTPNVVVQFCPVTVDRRDIDVDGNPSMYTHTVGTGPVAVFRNGVRIDGTWSRPDASAGTSYRDAAGAPIALAPGGAWIVLAAVGAPLTTG